MKFSTGFVIAAAATSVSAHTRFISLNGGKIGDGIRLPGYDGPIQDVSSNSIACNGAPNSVTGSSTVINVAAGSTAKIQWRHGTSGVIDGSHKGPVMAYMKKVSNAVTDSGAGSGWFKISQDAFDGSSWGVDRLIASGGVQSVNIPSCIAPGQYLLRAEIIALHSANSPGGAQFYMECAQINVTGGSASKTPATVSLPGAYKSNDPGVQYNLYAGSKTYTVPGPSVFTC